MPEDEPTPEEAPDQRRVSRLFQAEVDLRGVELPDWEFITKLIGLFRPYVAPAGEIDTLVIRGRDSRGSYSAQDLDAFREEHAERGEDLESFSVRVYGKDDHGLYGFTVNYTADYGRADFEGGDEVMVNGLAARVEKLAEAARARVEATEEAARRVKQEAARRALEDVERRSEPVPVTVVAPSPPKRSLWTHPWIIAVVGGTIAILLAALVVYLVSR